MDNILEITNLTKNFHDGEKVLEILRGVNLHLRTAETIAIVGRSGTGKSTLLSLLGLLDRPNSGTIKLKEYETTTLSETQRTTLRGKAIGFVFQQHHLLQDFNALENVCLAGNFALKNPGKNYAMDLLHQVGLSERLTHKPARMSGGEQQRVAIARALYGHPALLLCDEPTGNLDPITGNAVMDLLLQMAKKHQTAMLLVTHDSAIAKRADKILTLENGVLT